MVKCSVPTREWLSCDDNPGHDSAQRLNAQRQRRDVEQQHLFRRLRTARKDIRLHRSAERDNFVGIQIAMRLALEEFFYELTDTRNSRRASDEHGFVDLARRQTGVLHGLLDRADGAINDWLNQLFELCPRDLALIMLAARKRNLKRCSFLPRQRDLRLFDNSLPNRLHNLSVAPHIDTEIALDIVESNVDQQIVDVVAAKMSVAVGRNHLEDAFVQLEDGNVEGAAAQIVNCNRRGFLLVQTIGQRRGCGLIYQAQDSSPAMRPASFVACRCASLKYAGTVTTALLTGAEK